MTTTSGEMTFYDILGVAPEADESEIKKSYRNIMKSCHPDVARDDPTAADRAAMANIAYATLSDPAKRMEYDKALAGPTEEELAQAAQEQASSFEDEWGTEWTPGAEDGVFSTEIVDEGESVIDDDLMVVDDAPLPPRYAGPKWAPQVMGPPYLVSGFSAKPYWLLALACLVLWGLLQSISAFLPQSSMSIPPSSKTILGIALMVVQLIAWIAGIVLARKRDELAVPESPKPVWLKTIGALVALSIVAIVVSMFVSPFGGLVWAGVGFLSTYLPLSYVFYAGRLRKELNRIVPAETLMGSNRFGALPGGVAADQVDLVLAELNKLSSVRVLMCQNPDSWFSHAVVCGHRVAFVRGVYGAPGFYRWSGPSLLVQMSRQNLPVELLNVSRNNRGVGLEQQMAALRTALEGRAEVASMFAVVSTEEGDVVGAPPSATRPAVVRLDDLEDLVGFFINDGNNPPLEVNHDVVARTWAALNR